MLPIPRTLNAAQAPRASPGGIPDPLSHPGIPLLEPRTPPAPNPGRPPPPPRLPNGDPTDPRRDTGSAAAHHALQAHLPRRVPPTTPRRARERPTLHPAPTRGRLPRPRSLEARTLAGGRRGAEGGDGTVVLGVWQRWEDVHRE